MENSNEKLNKEIEFLREQIKTNKHNRMINYVKTIALFIGSIILFFIIQKPESAINSRNSEETINRERAKLILQILQEKNPEIRDKGLKIVKATYPSISKVLDSIESQIEQTTSIEIQSMKLEELENKKALIEENIKKSNSPIEKSLLENNLEMVKIQIGSTKTFLNNH